MSNDGATYGEVEGNLCPLLFYTREEAGLFIGDKLISQSGGRGIGEEASQEARQCKVCPHSVWLTESVRLLLS